MASKHLNGTQIRGLEKIGAVIAPGDDELPAFSQIECASRVDRVLDYMPAGDLGDLKMLLVVLGWMPQFMVSWLIRFLERSPGMRGPLAPLLRFMRLGIRGLVLSLYYSHPRVHAVLGYEVSVYTGDLASSEKGAPVVSGALVK